MTEAVMRTYLDRVKEPLEESAGSEAPAVGRAGGPIAEQVERDGRFEHRYGGQGGWR